MSQLFNWPEFDKESAYDEAEVYAIFRRARHDEIRDVRPFHDYYDDENHPALNSRQRRLLPLFRGKTEPRDRMDVFYELADFINPANESDPDWWAVKRITRANNTYENHFIPEVYNVDRTVQEWSDRLKLNDPTRDDWSPVAQFVDTYVAQHANNERICLASFLLAYFTFRPNVNKYKGTYNGVPITFAEAREKVKTEREANSAAIQTLKTTVNNLLDTIKQKVLESLEENPDSAKTVRSLRNALQAEEARLAASPAGPFVEEFLKLNASEEVAALAAWDNAVNAARAAAVADPEVVAYDQLSTVTLPAVQLLLRLKVAGLSFTDVGNAVVPRNDAFFALKEYKQTHPYGEFDLEDLTRFNKLEEFRNTLSEFERKFEHTRVSGRGGPMAGGGAGSGADIDRIVGEIKTKCNALSTEMETKEKLSRTYDELYAYFTSINAEQRRVIYTNLFTFFNTQDAKELMPCCDHHRAPTPPTVTPPNPPPSPTPGGGGGGGGGGGKPPRRTGEHPTIDYDPNLIMAGFYLDAGGKVQYAEKVQNHGKLVTPGTGGGRVNMDFIVKGDMVTNEQLPTPLFLNTTGIELQPYELKFVKDELQRYRDAHGTSWSSTSNILAIPHPPPDGTPHYRVRVPLNGLVESGPPKRFLFPTYPAGMSIAEINVRPAQDEIFPKSKEPKPVGTTHGAYVDLKRKLKAYRDGTLDSTEKEVNAVVENVKRRKGGST